MTADELNRQLDRLAEKRNWAADVKGNGLLALSYQLDIDKLLADHGHLLAESRPQAFRHQENT